MVAVGEPDPLADAAASAAAPPDSAGSVDPGGVMFGSGGVATCSVEGVNVSTIGASASTTAVLTTEVASGPTTSVSKVMPVETSCWVSDVLACSASVEVGP